MLILTSTHSLLVPVPPTLARYYVKYRVLKELAFSFFPLSIISLILLGVSCDCQAGEDLRRGGEGGVVRY